MIPTSNPIPSPNLYSIPQFLFQFNAHTLPFTPPMILWHTSKPNPNPNHYVICGPCSKLDPPYPNENLDPNNDPNYDPNPICDPAPNPKTSAQILFLYPHASANATCQIRR